MQHNENLPGGSVWSNETLLLCLAVGLAVVFLGLLAYDLIRRRRRARRHRRRRPEGLPATLFKPVQRAQAFQSDLERMLHERSRHRRRHERKRPEIPP